MFNYPVIEERCSCGASTQTVGTSSSAKWQFDRWRADHVCPPKPPADPRTALIRPLAEAWGDHHEFEPGGPSAKTVLFRQWPALASAILLLVEAEVPGARREQRGRRVVSTRSMKILNINAASTGQTGIALPYETDEQVESAWEYIFRRNCVNVRPEPDVNNQDRAMLEYCANAFREGKELHLPPADQTRGLISQIRQSEMSHDIRELFEPTN